MYLLDLDGSLGTTEDCADAIEKSLKKLNLLGRKIVTKGQATDSGGGGVLDKLAEELELRGLTVQDEDYLIGACSIHCLQLQISNPIVDLIGNGGVGNRNATQLLNIIYHLQGYMAWDQVVTMLNYCQEWVDQQLIEGGEYQPDPTDKGDVEFAAKFNHVRKFRDFQPIGETKWKRCSACITTRWQYVGAASKYGFEYYLILLKFTQLCINQCKSNIKINQAASDLQSLLINPLFYSDVCLLHCFHDGHFKRHMDWMMQSNDLTNKCGFQAHQIAVRYYIMERDLLRLKTDVNDYNGFFHHFVRSLSLLDDNGEPLHGIDSQKSKAQSFVDKSLDSLHKHFSRWLDVKLLPASLMAEKPLTMVVSRVITGVPAPWPAEAPDSAFDPTFDYRAMYHFGDNGPSDMRPEEEKQRDAHYHGLRYHDQLTTCRSQAHKGNICLPAFEQWLQNKLSLNGDVTYQGDILQACQLVLHNVDFRNYAADPLVYQLWQTFLPLASNAQFVERGVKEAKIVASTGRKEEQRSAYAIIRSFDVLCKEINRDTPVVDCVEALIMNGEAAVERDEMVRQRLGEDQHNEAWQEASRHLYGEHFKCERVQGQIDSVLETAEANRPTNVRQRV